MRNHWRSALAGLLVLGLLAACGDDDEPEATQTTEAEEATSTTAAPDAEDGESGDGYSSVVATEACAPVSAKAGLPARSLLFMPFFIPLDNGAFEEDLKLELELQEMRVPAIGAALVSGDIDFSFAGGAAMRLALEGAPVRRIADTAEVNATQLMAAEDITSIEDLRGKSIGVSGGGGSVTVGLSRILEAEGLNPERDVTIVPLGGLANVTAALVEGSIQAGMLTTPFTAVVEDAGGHALATMADYFPGSPGGVAASVSGMEDNTDVVKRMLWATVYGMDWVRTHPEESITWIMENQTDFTREAAEKLYEGEVETWTFDGQAEAQAVLNELVEPGQPAPQRTALDESVDYTLLDEVLEALDAGEAPC